MAANRPKQADRGKSEHRLMEQSMIQRSSLTATGHSGSHHVSGNERWCGYAKPRESPDVRRGSAGPLRRVFHESREAYMIRNRNIPPQAQAEASARSVVRLKSWGKGPRGHAAMHAGVNADPVQEQIR